jgi:hypothetical protein
MDRYFVDESRLDFERAQAVGTRVLDWAVPRADAFALRLDPTIYANRAQYERIAALGEQTISPSDRHQTIAGGKPPAQFVAVVTAQMALTRSVSSDLSCVEDIALYQRGARYYAMIDYGRTQLLDVDGEALAELRAVLGADADVLIPAPAVRRMNP